MVCYYTCSSWYATIPVPHGILLYLFLVVCYYTCSSWYATIPVPHGMLLYMFLMVCYYTCSSWYATIHVPHGILLYLFLMVCYYTYKLSALKTNYKWHKTKQFVLLKVWPQEYKTNGTI